ncbi:HDOD domain-containing protein [Oleiharenicola sp. Vm1]|uniref:HDOD domain-containing protein n=1 Tax=Oleiharenicola sp. Vm1 TaxID=3398393 RepID=UPI0039F527A3
MTLDHATIVSLGSRLPPSLGVLGRLQTLLNDPTADLDDIVELVNIDPALTFQVIKLANSALYGLRARCESLEDAVARVGFGDIHQIVGLAVSRHAFQGELPVYDIAGGRLWENAVAIGTLNAELALLAGGDARAAYATGLLRSIGKVVLNNFAPLTAYPGEAAAPRVHEWEKAQHGVDAAEVSAVLLDHWRFAPETIGAVRGQHAPELQPEFAGAAARLHLACGMAAGRGCALPGESAGWRVEPAMFRLAGVPAETVAEAVERAHRRFVACAMLEWSSAA